MTFNKPVIIIQNMNRYKIANYLPLLVLIPMLWQIIILYFGIFNLMGILSLLIALSFVLSIFIYVYFKTERIILHINKYGIENAPREYKIHDGENYTGIVIIHKKYVEKKALTSYISAPMLFIEYLKKESRPFKLAVDPSYSEFEKLIADSNCNKLYIIGHGRLYRLIIGPNKEDTIWYRDFIGYPHKEKVVQLHCNHRDWFFKNRNLRSLTDILHANTDFKQKGMITHFSILDYFLQKINEKI
jgi:hypothetical protein